MSPALISFLVALPATLLAASALGVALHTRARLAEFAERADAPPVADPGAEPPARKVRAGAPSAVGPTLIAVPDLAPPAPEPVAIPAELSLRFGAIWDLADSGATPSAIAQRVGQPVGQVELILGLRRPAKVRAPGASRVGS